MLLPITVLFFASCITTAICQVDQMNCPYSVQTGQTMSSDISPQPYATTPTAEMCWFQCCNYNANNVKCAASAYVSASGACYLMSSAVEGTWAQSGTILYTAGSTPIKQSYGNCKRGVAYDFSSPLDISAISNMAWWYNWNTQPQSTVASTTVEYVPMVWGKGFSVSTVISQIPAGSKYLLGFNEPNFDAQSDLTPAQAAALWPQIQQIASAKNLKIVGPAVNWCGGGCTDTNPFDWYTDFFGNCTGCQVDFIGAHWYSCGAYDIANYISTWKSLWPSYQLWLTEFDCPDVNQLLESGSSMLTYQQQQLEYLDNEPYVFRYSWFAGRTTVIPNVDLLASNGTLTTLGQNYNTYNLASSCAAAQAANSGSSFSPPPASNPPPASIPSSPTPASTPASSTPASTPASSTLASTPASSTPASPTPTTYDLHTDSTVLGDNMINSGTTSYTTGADCWNLCVSTQGCVACTYTPWYNNYCYLKDNTMLSQGLSSQSGTTLYTIPGLFPFPASTSTGSVAAYTQYSAVYSDDDTVVTDTSSSGFSTSTALVVGVAIGIFVALFAVLIVYIARPKYRTEERV